jgi:hypothetical protein
MRALLERTTSYPSLIHQAQDSPGVGSYANLVADAPLRSGHSPNQACGSSHDTSRGSFQAGRGSRISSGLCDIHLRESDYLSHAPQASVSRPSIRAASHTSSLWRMGRRSACRLRKAYSSIQPLCTGQRFDRGKAPTAAIRQPHFMDLCRLISFATKPYQYAHVLSRAMRHSFKVRRVMDLVGRAISGCPRRPNRQSA